MGWTAYQPRVKWTRQAVRNTSMVHTGLPAKPQTLAHPDLQGLSDMEFEIRSSLFSRLINGVPQSQWINWYGGLIRPDGGNGMYATEALAESWSHRTVSDVKHGPG